MKQTKRWVLIGGVVIAFMASAQSVNTYAIETEVKDIPSESLSPLPLALDEQELLVQEEVETNPPPVSDIPVSAIAQQDLPELRTPAKMSPLAVQAPDQSAVETTIDTPLPIDSSPVRPQSDMLITTFGRTLSGQFDFLQLHNTSDDPLYLNGWYLELLYATTTEEVACQVQLHDYILSNQYIILADELSDSLSEQNQGVIYRFSQTNCTQDEAFQLANIKLFREDEVVEDVRLGYFNQADTQTRVWARKGITNTYRTGEAKDFEAYTGEIPLHGSVLYIPPSENNLQIIEVLIHPRDCLPLADDMSCRGYIKVYNPTNDPVNLADYRLRAGSPATSATSSNTSMISGTVAPGHFAILVNDIDGEPLAMNSDAGSLWFQDRYGVKDYASSVTPYDGANRVAHQGKSWAYDEADESWKWATPSPLRLANQFHIETEAQQTESGDELVPCRADQYRSEETNRCRNNTTTSSLVPCRSGQYRSPETNRCRNIATSTSSLKPCDADQYRSPETNRCRNIVTAATNLVPCDDDQYRSEETNRCRNIVASTIPEAAFAVEPVADTASTFVGWWALGGVVALAAGYGIWEWRHELRAGVRKIATFFTSGK